MKPIAEVRAQQQNLATLILVAVLLGLGVNLVAAAAVYWLRFNPEIFLLLGLFFLLIGGYLLLRTLFSSSPKILRFRGALAFDESGDSIKEREIFGYDFNREMCTYLQGFLAENRAYKKKFFDSKGGDILAAANFDLSELNYHSIIRSVLEFWVLHELELHLNSYFVENKIDRSLIVTIKRRDLDPEVLENRVVELFTKDMGEREAFLEHGKRDSEGIVVSSTGEGGAIYRRLEIELPPGSLLYRDERGYVVVANKLFDLTIEPHFEGYSTFVPSQLFNDSSEEWMSPLLITLAISIKLHNRWYLTEQSIMQYQWLDSFIERLENAISIDRLTQRLNPDLKGFLKS